MRRLAPIILLLAILGCQKAITVPHPGQIDALDGATYDALLASQSVLDNAKIAIKQGKLPASAKGVVNGAGTAYNTLRDVWLEYRAGPNASTAEKIKAAALNLNNLILQLRGLGVNP